MSFFEDAKLFSRTAILSQPGLVPAARGVYAWFFREPPPLVSIEGCYVRDGLTLLYVGISPKTARSRQNLRKRITYHFRGNAEGSTLRLTLGTLLAQISDFPLRRVGSGRRMTFTHLGEQWLDDWLDRNAFVCWVDHDEPWALEHELLATYSLPLNIQDNRHHPFSTTLSQIRQEAIPDTLAHACTIPDEVTAPALHLATSIRSFRAERLSDFVGRVIAGDADGAHQIREDLTSSR